MRKEINEGDTRHPAAPGWSHSLQIYPNKMEKNLTFGDAFVHAANPAGLGCIPLRPPCPVHALHSPLCTPVRSQFCTLLMLLCMVPEGLFTPGASLGTGWGACGTLSSH